MSQNDSGFSEWTAVEKEPTRPVVIGGAPPPDHASAALRALGSIWLVTLMFLFVGLATASVGSHIYLNSKLENETQLEPIHNVMVYHQTLDAYAKAMAKERTLALWPPAKDGLWLEIDQVKEANKLMRDQNKAAKAASEVRSAPRSSPSCLDPRNPLCRQ